MASLYQLTGEFLELLDMLEDGSDDEQVILDTLEGIDYEVEVKAENYAKIIKELEVKSKCIKEEIQRLTARAAALENKAKMLKTNLEQCMIATGKTKFKTDLFSFGIQKNPAKLVIDNELDVPEEFLIKQEPKINSKAIKELLKFSDLPYAHLEQSESLRIR